MLTGVNFHYKIPIVLLLIYFLFLEDLLWRPTLVVTSFQVFVNNTNLTFLYKNWMTTKWQLTITGLEVWCLPNCANLSCLTSLKLSNPDKVMLYWIYKLSKFKKWSGAWNKFLFKESAIQHMSDLHSWKKHQTSKPVMVSCVFNSHWRQFYFCWNLLKSLGCARFGEFWLFFTEQAFTL